MSEVQRAHDAGAVLRLLSDFLRVEMHQLWCDHRPHDFQQPAEELGSPGCPTCSACGDTLAQRWSNVVPVETVLTQSSRRTLAS